ncbi:MAG: hypothetical protein LQ340_008124, partial [Diploschistes diacapsis]
AHEFEAGHLVVARRRHLVPVAFCAPIGGGVGTGVAQLQVPDELHLGLQQRLLAAALRARVAQVQVADGAGGPRARAHEAGGQRRLLGRFARQAGQRRLARRDPARHRVVQQPRVGGFAGGPARDPQLQLELGLARRSRTWRSGGQSGGGGGGGRGRGIWDAGGAPGHPGVAVAVHAPRLDAEQRRARALQLDAAPRHVDDRVQLVAPRAGAAEHDEGLLGARVRELAREDGGFAERRVEWDRDRALGMGDSEEGGWSGGCAGGGWEGEPGHALDDKGRDQTEGAQGGAGGVVAR